MSISYKQLKSKLRFVNKRQKREKPMTLEQIHKEYEEELNQSEEEYMVARLEMRKRKTEEAARRAMQENEDVEQHHLRMLQIAANEVNDFVDDYSGSFVEVDDSMTQQVTDHVQKWAEYSEKAKEWYLESFALNGEPDLSKKSEVFEASPCSCGQRGIVKMTLYFLNGNYKATISFTI
ncbi:hypothetical protein EDC96DRAFT_130439 [Choanephora cucurbitarum]|nr:hypothetical protein EDC96DRAFT_130439 [Choanephora cucurbitarum]